MKLIPQWKLWWKRWSTWLLSLIAGLSLNDLTGFMPSIQQYIPEDRYKAIMLGLSLLTFVALHIPQKSLAGGKP
jgi:hypothetical protein